MASCLNSHSNPFLWFEFESQLVKEELDELSLELDEAADLRHDLQASVGGVWKSVEKCGAVVWQAVKLGCFRGGCCMANCGFLCARIPSHTPPLHSFAVPSPRFPQVLAEAFHEKEDEVDSLTEQLEEARRKLEEAARQLEAASLRQGAAQRQLEAGMLQAAGLKVWGEAFMRDPRRGKVGAVGVVWGGVRWS